MQLAVNFSRAAAALYRERLIRFDLFKCPMWQSVIEEAQLLGQCYVHFPLRVGAGIGDALDTEAHRPADWARIEQLLEATGTSAINLHLAPTPEDHPTLPLDSTAPDAIERLTEALLADVQSVVDNFGAEWVIVESIYGEGVLHPALLPSVIQRVVEETGSGFLFDLAHAQLAAAQLGMDLYAYLEGLPLDHCREMHVTGVQVVDEALVARVEAAGAPDNFFLTRAVGQRRDHLPMTQADWTLLAWVLDQMESGRWRVPERLTFEYGGLGQPWEALTEESVLAEQVPRLFDWTRGQR